MIESDIISALTLPSDCMVNQRVPKKLLVENGAPTSADKRQINEGVEELVWVAALKPANIGVPEYRDSVREYLEIALLTVTFRISAKQNRLIELIHRAIPYPVILIAGEAGNVCLSLAHKRWSQGEIGSVVIEEIRQTPPFRQESPTQIESAFLNSLALAKLPRANLFVLYQGWLDRVSAFAAARITGVFAAPDTVERGAALQSGLDARARLQKEIATLRARAAKEKQINRRVELNFEIQRLEAELSDIAKIL